MCRDRGRGERSCAGLVSQIVSVHKKSFHKEATLLPGSTARAFFLFIN